MSGRARRFLQPVLLVMCRHLNNSKQTGFHMYILKSLKVCNWVRISRISSLTNKTNALKWKYSRKKKYRFIIWFARHALRLVNVYIRRTSQNRLKTKAIKNSINLRSWNKSHVYMRKKPLVFQIIATSMENDSINEIPC